ncbi:hypothetical protein [Arhodomonas sp. AD133]|uniref:hypothetical protein n=1 Tax=Arhodomonas sp. AD133 TaxID=3415009 RepID=UPI003EB79A8B
MSTAIYDFRTGLSHLDQLLDVLRRQLIAFEQGRTPDMLLMHDIIDCLNRYTTVSEQGWEGELLDDLARADYRFGPARVVLTTEHDTLTQLGTHCLAVVEDIIAGAVITRPELATPVRHYIRLLRTHLRRERAYLRGHRAASSGLPARRHRPLRRQQPVEAFADLQDRIRQARATRQRDTTGTPVCAACAIDTADATPR